MIYLDYLLTMLDIILVYHAPALVGLSQGLSMLLDLLMFGGSRC